MAKKQIIAVEFINCCVYSDYHITKESVNGAVRTLKSLADGGYAIKLNSEFPAADKKDPKSELSTQLNWFKENGIPVTLLTGKDKPDFYLGPKSLGTAMVKPSVGVKQLKGNKVSTTPRQDVVNWTSIRNSIGSRKLL